MTILYDSDFLRYPEVKRHPILKGLEPYEKILVRNAPDGFWRARFFSHYTEQGTTGTYAYAVTTGSHYPFAIRYKGNEKYANTAFAAEFADIPQDAPQDAPQDLTGAELVKLLGNISREGIALSKIKFWIKRIT
jgi:hypothetical protein